MTSSSINWQQPFVNTFKHFTIASDKNVNKHGDISSQMDAQIKSSVYKIVGSSPMSNFINMPKLSAQSLGLTGRYIYILFKPMPNKCFSIHLDLATNEKTTIRVSFSNLFKEFKATSTWLQFPYVIQAPKGSVYEKTELVARDLSGSAPPITKWTIVCIDLISLTQTYSNRTFKCVRGFKLCANMFIKNVVTSDILYQPGLNHNEARVRNTCAFPRELAYPCEKFENWFQCYDYVSFPNESFQKPFESNGQSRIFGQYDYKTANSTPHGINAQVVLHSSESIALSNKYQKKSSGRLPLVGVQVDPDFVSPDEVEQQNSQDIHVYASLKTNANNQLSCASTASTCSSLSFANDMDNFETTLEPDPIMRIRKVIGFSSAPNTSIRWSRDGEYLIYGCHAIVVAYHLSTGEQYCYVGHADRVSCIALNSDNSLIASGQAGQYSLIRLWDFQTRKSLAIFRNHEHSLYLLEFSNCGRYLCGVGKDKQGKTMVVIWDVNLKTSAKLIAKAHTDVSIHKIMFISYDSTRLVSCGKDNVRFWRLKADSLRSCAVNLSAYLINNTNIEFTDMDMNENLIYATSQTGQIFMFNPARMEIEKVKVLQPMFKSESETMIYFNSLSVSDSYCAIGSSDSYVRIWPLDFNQVIVEAEHKTSISNCRFSPDHLRLVTCTSGGDMGVLDVKRREYSTLIRSHTDAIADVCIDRVNKHIATCSLDGSMRVWQLDTMKQLFEFSCSTGKKERPTRVCFSHTSQLACGFDSGKLKIFNTNEGKLLVELTQNAQITDLKYTNDSKRLICADSQRYLYLYDANYNLIRMLPNCISIPGSLTSSPDDQFVAVIGSSDQLLTVFESLTLNELLRIDASNELDKAEDEKAIRLSYSSQNLNHLICITSTNKLLKFDCKNGRLISSTKKLHRTNTDCLNVSSDGRYLVTSGDHVVKVWDYDMKLDKNYQTFVGHSSVVNRVLFINENKTLLSIGDTLIFWDFLAPGLDTDKVMPAGRAIASIDKKPHKPYEVKQFKVLDGKSFEQMKTHHQNQWSANVSFERPRTPPVAAVKLTENILLNGVIEDTFLNEDDTLLSNSSNASSQNLKAAKKFTNLPNLLSTSIVNGQEEEIQCDERHVENRTNGKKSNPKSHSSKANSLMRKKNSSYAKRRYAAPADKCGIKLSAAIGYNGKYSGRNMLWNAESEYFVFSIGSLVCVEDLKTNKQRLLYAHNEDVTVLTMRHDCTQMASASPHLLNNQCHLVIWDCVKFEKCETILHKNIAQINEMSYSNDDRFLIAISNNTNLGNSVIVIWSTYDYAAVCTFDSISFLVNDISWNPCKCNEFAVCGLNKSLSIWQIDEKPLRSVSLRHAELEIPIAIDEQHNFEFDFTAIEFSEEGFLYAATNLGLITVWDAKTKACFLNWRADTNEIDVLVSIKHKLITGSNKGTLKLWNVTNIHELKRTANKTSLKSDGLTLESEVLLNGAIKSCKYDPTLDIAIAATIKGTVWYVNWQEETSVRLVSSHLAHINSICCINDKFLSTASDDGSLNIWSLTDRERVVQFEVKSAALCQTLIECHNNKHMQKNSKYGKQVNCKLPLVAVGYADGKLRIFDIDKKNIVDKLQPLTHELTCIKYCKNSSIILVGSREGLIAVVDFIKEQVVKLLDDQYGAPITSLDCVWMEDKNQAYWLAASRDRRISVWTSKWNEDYYQMLDWLTFPAPPNENLKDAKQINWLDYPPSLAFFEPISNNMNKNDLNIVYVGYGLDKQMIVYNMNKKKITRTMSLSEWPECMAIAPNCNLVAFGTKTRLLQIKDYHQSTFQDYAQHSDTVQAICFSNNGKKLFSSAFNEIFIWDVSV
jgi:WD40 repeat protein